MATSLEELTAVDPDLLEKVAAAPLTAPDVPLSASMQRAEARIKADDLSRRGIAFYTTPSGPKEITDPTGAPLTGFDKKHQVAWDSAGDPQQISFDPGTGEPQTAPAYDAAPVIEDKKGNLYKAPPGLPWQQIGENPEVKAELWQEEADKLNAQADSALAPYQTQAAIRVRDAVRVAKKSTKDASAALAILGTPLTNELGQPIVDLNTADAATLRAHIEATYNKEYGAPAANATPLFGGGRLSSEAEALRKDIDQRKQRAFEVADAHLAAIDEVKAARMEHGAIADQRSALRGERLESVNARRIAAGLPPVTLPQIQQQGEGASIGAHNADSAGSTPAPATSPIANQKKPDTSFWSAFWQGIDQPLEAIGVTAELFGIPGGTMLRNLTNAPENYESAASRFIQPKAGDTTILGFAPAYIPRAIVEQVGQLGGSIISKVVGNIVGAAVGGAVAAPAGGPGAVATGAGGAATGAIVGQFVGPFLFSALQIAGPTARERAKNNGRTEPDASDIAWALMTAAGSGSLDSIGDQFLPGGKNLVNGAVKKIASAIFAEGATEGAQSLVEQAGENLGTRTGAPISGKQAVGEGVLGALTAGVATSAEALLDKKTSPAPVAGAPPIGGTGAAVGGATASGGPPATSGATPPAGSTSTATTPLPQGQPGTQVQGSNGSPSSNQTAGAPVVQEPIAPAAAPAGTTTSAPPAGSATPSMPTPEPAPPAVPPAAGVESAPSYNQSVEIPEGAVTPEMEDEVRERLHHDEVAPILEQLDSASLRGVEIVSNRTDRAFTTTREKVTINTTRLAHALTGIEGDEAKRAYVRRAVGEELKHRATFDALTDDEIKDVGKNLSADERKATTDLRGEQMNDLQSGAEAIRIFMQAEEGDEPTEAFKLFTQKARTDGKFRAAVRRVLDHVRELAAGIKDGKLSKQLTDGIARARARLDEIEAEVKAAAQPPKETPRTAPAKKPEAKKPEPKKPEQPPHGPEPAWPVKDLENLRRAVRYAESIGIPIGDGVRDAIAAYESGDLEQMAGWPPPVKTLNMLNQHILDEQKAGRVKDPTSPKIPAAPPKPTPPTAAPLAPAPPSSKVSKETKQEASDFLDGLMAAEPEPASPATVKGLAIQSGGRTSERTVEVSEANLKAVVVRKSALVKLLKCLES